MQSVDKLIFKANILMAGGDYEKSLSLLKMALKKDKHNPEVYVRLSVVYDLVQDIKKSKEMLDKSLDIDPDYPRAHYLRGIDLANEGKLKEAMKEYILAIENYSEYDDPLRNEHLSEAHTNLGTLYYEFGQYETAIKEWRLAINYDRNNEEVRNNLRDFSKPLKEPKVKIGFEYFHERGVILSDQGRLSESMNVLKKAYSLKPKDPIINYNMGLVYGKLNDFKKASKHLKKFLEIAPDHQEAQKIRKLVKKIDNGDFG